MNRIDQITGHPLFLEHLHANEAAEADRRFCRHNIEHFLDVARIGWIINLEERMGIDREWIYGAALLHDLGKHVQYENGTPHEKVSGEIAPKILKDCGFSEEEIERIVEAILSHREKDRAEEKTLNGILYRADKASRACFACRQQEECNWENRKKNLQLRY